MACKSSSVWLSVRSPVASTTASSGSLQRHPFLFFLCSKPIFIPSCSHSSTDSSPSPSVSDSRPWYNPLRRSKFDHALEIERHWVEADQPLASPEKFTVASYNILADRNASEHKDLYFNVPSQHMKWDRRKRVICNEIVGWDPDIICLQEVDKYFDISNILVKAGYRGSYKRRTGNNADGCAMFWKADKFQLLEEKSITFKDIGLRDNVAQLLVFEMCESDSRKLLIGNIHVLYNPSRGEVKLGQIRFLMSRAQALSEKWGNAPIVLAGDFNSTPQSGIYKFLSSSELNIMLYSRKELSGQKSCHPAQVSGYTEDTVSPFNLVDRFAWLDNKLSSSNMSATDLCLITVGGIRLLKCWTNEEVKTATGNSERHLVVHPLKLNSSYATVKGSTSTRGFNGEPLATSYHSKFLGTVDYLWYSDGIVPTRVLDTIPIDVLLRTGGLPCKTVGSDHLALVSEFAFSITYNITTERVAAAASPELGINEHNMHSS